MELTSLKLKLIEVKNALNLFRKKPFVRSRADLYKSICRIQFSDLKDIAGLNLDIVVDDMKDEVEDLHFKLKGYCFGFTFLAIFNMFVFVFTGWLIAIIMTLIFVKLSHKYGKLSMEVADLSTAVTYIITERENVPPYS